MKYLYLDNFRGFQDVCVPLLDVNFLVGENSTGKTSLMTMLSEFTLGRIMASEAPMAGQPRLGHFSEMVSAHGNSQDYFRLGYIEEDKDKKGKGLLISYKSVEGAPRISRVTYTTTQGETTLEFDKHQVFVKSAAREHAENASVARDRLLIWSQEHAHKRDESWTTASLPFEVMDGRFSLWMALTMVRSETDNDASNNFLESFPMAPPIAWIAPIRSKPLGTYTYNDTPPDSSADGLHTPYIIKRILKSKKGAKEFKDFLRHVGSASGLFQKIKVTRLGGDETSPFEVDAYLDDKALAINSLGYGVSQSLPVFVELFLRTRGTWFAIQQPEVHLHPRAQAVLGDVFFEMAVSENKKFLIETHSDFIIDRFRLNLRKKKKGTKIPQAQILFFERRDKHNVVVPMPIGANGDLPSDQPSSYRRFFVREQMNLLGIN